MALRNSKAQLVSAKIWRSSGVVLSLMLGLAGCGGGSNNDATSNANLSATSLAEAGSGSAQANLGAKIFKDESLSASGKMSCATCHDPASAHAQTNSLPVQLGGAKLDVPGFRAVPSLRYLSFTPAFGFGKDGKAAGGFDLDGRVDTLAAQAMRPFVAPHEMANPDKASVVAKIMRVPYAEEFRRTYGAGIFSDAEQAFDRIVFSLQQFQKEDAQFHSFDSKFDQFLAGKVRLDDAELRGLALFNDASKGNCAACHTSAKGTDGSLPLFTDFSYDNIGVPRNRAIAATKDAAYFDLGLCGPDRTDLSARDDLCGAFKVPSLRNVAMRKVFFHNGRFSNLRDVVGFYVRRDTNPEEWYPKAANGSILKFDDLPAQYVGNVNVTEVPYNRQRGMAPALSAAEIDDVVRFLGTITDGYQAK